MTNGAATVTDTLLGDLAATSRDVREASRRLERSLVPRVLSPGPGEAAAFVAEARRAGHEGVMAKSLAAGYAAGSRGAAWLKIKQVATLDLVVLAAEWGSGRRRGWLSNLPVPTGLERPEPGVRALEKAMQNREPEQHLGADRTPGVELPAVLDSATGEALVRQPPFREWAAPAAIGLRGQRRTLLARRAAPERTRPVGVSAASSRSPIQRLRLQRRGRSEDVHSSRL